MRISDITPADLAELGHLLPRSAATLLRVAGQDAGLALLNALPGVFFQMPHTDGKRRGNTHAKRRTAQLQALVGDDALAALRQHYGGGPLEVPTCLQIKVEKRNRWLRQQFDALTRSQARGGAGLSRNQAVYELSFELRKAFGEALSNSGLEAVLDRPSPTAAAPRAGGAEAQLDLFTPP